MVNIIPLFSQYDAFRVDTGVYNRFLNCFVVPRDVGSLQLSLKSLSISRTPTRGGKYFMQLEGIFPVITVMLRSRIFHIFALT
jgi:hypothetical protein